MIRLFTVCSLVLGLALSSMRANEPFAFAALGCMPYGLPATAPEFERLIAEINRHQPAFTVHCGDIKAGGELATDEGLEQIHDYFMRFDGPLIYTPGDNEWTDVHRASAGGHDPLQWLEKIRRRFFSTEWSLGRTPLQLTSQRKDAAYSRYVENARWSHGGVVFATIHLVGSNNNDQPEISGAVSEFLARDAANVAWLRATFTDAREQNAAGVALFFQADPFAFDYGRNGRDSGYIRFLDTLETEAREFGRPVLLVHADEHRYRLDRALAFETDGVAVPNVTRLQTFGESDVHGVLVVVDPSAPDVFLPGPLVVPGNPLPRYWGTRPKQ
jgi:hypothetical protein